MVNAASLKKPTAAKGEPPKRGQGIDPIKADTRAATPNTRLNLSVPQTVFDEFSQLAGEECGFKKGAKTEFFMAMLEDWKQRNRT